MSLLAAKPEQQRLAKIAGETGVAESTVITIYQQMKSLAETAIKLGIPAETFAYLTGEVVRSGLESKVREGYATAEEGLAVLLQKEGGCVDVATATTLFRKPEPVTPQSITERIRSGEIIAYRTGSGQYRIPRWQFRPEGGTIPGIAETLAQLQKLRSWDQLAPFTFFLQRNPLTRNQTPLAELRAGNLDKVLRAAASEI
jgi:hypothetical protein